MNEKTDLKSILASILAEHDCETGTLHRIGADGAFLDLVCQIGVPEILLEKIRRIPVGKGIAGVAAEKREPVTLCNLQQDLGGVAKPDARKTGVSGSLAVPVFTPCGQHLAGTLGIGKHTPHDFSAGEIARLEARAETIGRIFAAGAAGVD